VRDHRRRRLRPHPGTYGDGHIYLRSQRLGLSLRLTPQEAATLRDDLTATLNQQEQT
jgi:hypothetical protein